MTPEATGPTEIRISERRAIQQEDSESGSQSFGEWPVGGRVLKKSVESEPRQSRDRPTPGTQVNAPSAVLKISQDKILNRDHSCHLIFEVESGIGNFSWGQW